MSASFPVLPQQTTPPALGIVATVRLLRRAASNWPAIILRRAANRYLHIATPITYRPRGGTVVMTAPARDTAWWSFVEVMAADSYRLRELPVDEIAFVVDLGANLGDFSVAVAERFPGVHVLAFEPGPRAYQQLHANVVTNGLERVIDTRCCAVVGSAASNEVMLWERPIASTSSSLLAPSAGDGGKSAAGVRVAAIALAEALTSLAVPVDLLKVDVEGAEYEIFAETPISALANVRRAVVEYHPVDGHGSLEIVDAFRRAGFRWLRHEPASFSAGFGLLWFERGPTGHTEMLS